MNYTIETYKRTELWFCRIPELNIFGSGKTPEQAFKDLGRAIETYCWAHEQIKNDERFNNQQQIC